VDVVGINSMEKAVILGECKWSPRPIDRDVLENLIGKTDEFVPTHPPNQISNRILHIIMLLYTHWNGDKNAD
jgi:hypothetical protein